MKSELNSKLREIKIFLFDLEGVLHNETFTDEKFFELIEKTCKEFTKLGLTFGIVTARREDELVNKLKTINGCNILASSIDKVSAVDKFLSSLRIDYKNVFYMGDDLLDIPLLKKCRLSSSPKNGRREVKRIVSFVSKSTGGEKILKEIIDLYKLSQEGSKKL